jgi:hypothetical protein
MIPCPWCGHDSDNAGVSCSVCGASWDLAGHRIQEFFRSVSWGRQYLAAGPGGAGTVLLEVLEAGLSQQDGFRAAFLDEGSRLSEQLRGERKAHTPIARVLATGEQEGRLYLIREWIPGETLESRLRRGAPPDLDHLVAAAVDLCTGLSRLHAGGFVHGGCSTGAVLFPEEDASERVAVLAAHLPGRAALEGAGDTTEAGDQRALARVLCETLAGSPEAGPAELPPEVSPALERARSPDPAECFRRIADLGFALESGLAARRRGVTGGGTPTRLEQAACSFAARPSPARGEAALAPAIRRSEPSSSRRRVLLTALATAVLVVGVVGVALLPGSRFRVSREVMEAEQEVQPLLVELRQRRADLNRQLLQLPPGMLVDVEAALQDRIAGLQELLDAADDELGHALEADELQPIKRLGPQLQARLFTLERELPRLKQLVRTARLALEAQSATTEIDRILADTSRPNHAELAAQVSTRYPSLQAATAALDQELRRSQDLANLDPGRLREVQEELEAIRAGLEQTRRRLEETGQRFEEAQADCTRLLARLREATLAILTDQERVVDEPEEQAELERWLDSGRRSVDDAERACSVATTSHEAVAARLRLEELVAEYEIRAKELRDRRQRLEDEAALARAPERALALEHLLEAVASLPGGLEGTGCTGEIERIRRVLSLFQSGGPRPQRVRQARELLGLVEEPQRCLAGLFRDLAVKQREQLRAVVDGTDDGSAEFERIRSAYRESIQQVDVDLDPLAVINAYQKIEYSIYKHLSRFVDRVQVEVNRILEAVSHTGFRQQAKDCQIELDRIRGALSGKTVDLVKISGGLRELQERVANLEVRIETELRRDEAQALRDRAEAMEIRYKEYFVSGRMLPTEEDIYQRAVTQLGDGRIRFAKGDYSGAKACFEFSIAQFSRIRLP